jgi:hypothetical protein
MHAYTTLRTNSKNILHVTSQTVTSAGCFIDNHRSGEPTLLLRKITNATKSVASKVTVVSQELLQQCYNNRYDPHHCNNVPTKTMLPTAATVFQQLPWFSFFVTKCSNNDNQVMQVATS